MEEPRPKPSASPAPPTVPRAPLASRGRRQPHAPRRAWLLVVLINGLGMGALFGVILLDRPEPVDRERPAQVAEDFVAALVAGRGVLPGAEGDDAPSGYRAAFLLLSKERQDAIGWLAFEQEFLFFEREVGPILAVERSDKSQHGRFRRRTGRFVLRCGHPRARGAELESMELQLSIAIEGERFVIANYQLQPVAER